MIYNFFVLFIVTVVTFLYGVLRKKIDKKKDNQFLFKINGYYLHHSLLGLVFMFLSLFKPDSILFVIGIGIIIGHGLEEIYFGKKDIKTFFIFISK